MDESLYDLIRSYCNIMEIDTDTFESYTKGEMNELIEDAFNFYKEGFNCYEDIRTKIRNRLTPITNSIALLEYFHEKDHIPSQEEMNEIINQLKLAEKKLLNL